MMFRSAMSIRMETLEAAAEACESMQGLDPDLVMLFASRHHAPKVGELLEAVQDSVQPRNIVGCLAEGVIGGEREVERQPGVAVWAAKLPGVRVLPFVLDQHDVEGIKRADDWIDRIGVGREDLPGLVVIPDPFSIDVERCLSELDAALPGSTIVGGMASGARSRGQNRLFLNEQVFSQGMVGLSLSGPIGIRPVVSQGCRPVGEPLVITRAEHNVIHELRGRPAVAMLHDVFGDAPPRDQQLMQSGVLVGTVIDEHLESFGLGDFLIRNLMGIVGDTALAVNALVRPGQTIQFHVRDSQTAEEEMRSLLAGRMSDLPKPPAGALMFNCNGRGEGMFGKSNHDIGLLKDAAACPTAGFFAAGEIGPVGNKTFIHGFTSSLVLFHEV